MTTKRHAAILLAIAGFATLVVAEVGATAWRPALFATWFALNSAAVVLFTMSKRQDLRRRCAPTVPAEQRDPMLLTLAGAALAVGAVGGSMTDGAVSTGAAVLSAGGFTGWLYGPRLQTTRWRKNR